MAAAVHLVITLPDKIKDIHNRNTLTNELNMKFLSWIPWHWWNKSEHIITVLAVQTILSELISCQVHCIWLQNVQKISTSVHSITETWSNEYYLRKTILHCGV